MRLPDFLIIGAARCGTTWLYECLQAHRRLFLPAQKRPEPHFFLKEAEYARGIDYYSDRYFRGVSHALVAGEASTSYLYRPHAAARIARHLPDVKMIALLRNPIDRAFSNYMVSVRNNLETLSFSRAIRREPQRLARPRSPLAREVCPQAYIDRGRYFAQLAVYLRHFRPDRLHLILFDDLVDRPAAVLGDVHRFLGVHDDAEGFSANITEPRNAGDYRGAVVDAHDRHYILDQLKDDLQSLARLLGRDLSHWK